MQFLPSVAQPKFEKRKDRPDRWRVDVTFSGRRKKLYFEGRPAARDARRDFLHSIANGTFQQLFPEVARHLHFFNRRVDLIRWKEAGAAYLDHLEDRQARSATLESVEGHLRRAGEALGDPLIADLSPEKVKAYIVKTGKTENSRSSIRSALVAFLSWCGECGWCEKKAFHGMKWPVILRDKPRPAFLSVDEVKALFRHCFAYKSGGSGTGRVVDVRKTNQARAGLAVALFLGIRPGAENRDGGRAGELPQLRFKDFDLAGRSLLVPAEVSKTRVERLVTNVPAGVITLLKAGRFRPGDFVLPFGYPTFQKLLKETRDRVLEVEGIRVKWVQKILRHTFASFGYWRGLEWVIEAGGWKDPRILTGRYQGATTKEASEEFFALEFAPLRAKDAPAPSLSRFEVERRQKRACPVLTVSAPKRSKDPRPSPWLTYVRHGKEFVRRYHATEDIANLKRKAWLAAWEAGTFAEDFPKEAKAVGIFPGGKGGK